MLVAVVAVASAFTTSRHHTTPVTPLNMESESTAFLSSLSKSLKPKDVVVPGESSKFLSTLTQEKKKKNSLNVGAFLDALGTMYQDFQQDIQNKVQDDIKKVTTSSNTISMSSIRLPKSVRKHIRTLKTNNLMDEANRYFQAEMIKAQEKKRM